MSFFIFSFDFSGLFDTLGPFYFPVTLWFLLLLAPISMLPLLLPRVRFITFLGGSVRLLSGMAAIGVRKNWAPAGLVAL